MLVARFGDELVGEYETAWQYLMESYPKTDFQGTLHGARSMPAARRVMELSLPTSSAESCQMLPKEDHKLLFSRFDARINSLKASGVDHDENEIAEILRNNISDDCEVERHDTN